MRIGCIIEIAIANVIALIFYYKGKGESVLDHMLHTNGLQGNKSGDVSCDSYNNYDKDIQLLKDLGVSYG